MDNQTLALLIITFLIVLALLSRRKSRHIPVRSKRLAWARFYQEFYSKPENRNKKLRKSDYEFDHRRPFSRGGTHDPENIEVIPKLLNRKKGAKMPHEM